MTVIDPHSEDYDRGDCLHADTYLKNQGKVSATAVSPLIKLQVQVTATDDADIPGQLVGSRSSQMSCPSKFSRALSCEVEYRVRLAVTIAFNF